MDWFLETYLCVKLVLFVIFHINFNICNKFMGGWGQIAKSSNTLPKKIMILQRTSQWHTRDNQILHHFELLWRKWHRVSFTPHKLVTKLWIASTGSWTMLHRNWFPIYQLMFDYKQTSNSTKHKLIPVRICGICNVFRENSWKKDMHSNYRH